MNRFVNPYVTDAPLREGRGFFGRQDVLNWVVQELRSPATSALVLLGQRAIGKTSLLLQLERTLPADAFLPVYFDLQGRATRSLGQVLDGLAAVLTGRAGLQTPGPHLFDDQGHFFCHTFLPRFYAVALGESRRPVFLLDEFDVLDETAEAELPETAAVRALFPFLREVRAGDSRPVFVLAAGRQAADFGSDLVTAFDTPLVREMKGLDWESASELVHQAESDGTLQFSDLAVSHLLSFTNGHPYLTQLLCQRIWGRAYAEHPTEPPLIDTLAVEDAVPDTLETGGRTLAWLWNGLSPAEKIYAAALAEIADEGEVASEASVVRAIADHAAWLRTPEVELAPGSLVKRWVLEEAGGREHNFTVELVHLWVRQNKSLRAVKDEVGWTAPPAEQLFTAGKDFFDEWQWESAVRCFRDALEVNPHHSRARLRLGEALLELGQVDDAVAELVQAHELNQAEAHPSLARALAAQAREGAPSAQVQTPPFPSGEQALPARSIAAPLDASSEGREEQDDLETAPTGTIRAVYFNASRWMKQVRKAFGVGHYPEVLRLVLPVLAIPTLSALVFYGIGMSLARGMSGLAWMPPLFDASTFHRFALVSAILGVFPGLRFSYEFVKHPQFSLELVYLSLYRFALPFLAILLIYGVLALLSWASQASVSEDEWEGFHIFFDWLRRLWQGTNEPTTRP